MMRLFRQFILRHLKQEKLRTGATILGIALGIAVVVAIQMTNDSSVRGFAKAIETMSGRAGLEIVGVGNGIDELRLKEMLWLRQYGTPSAVIEGDAEAKVGAGKVETLRVLGVDVLRDRQLRDYEIETGAGGGQPNPRQLLDLLLDPRAIILTEKFTRRHGLKVGDQIELTFSDQAAPYTIRALLRDAGPARTLDGNFALLDIAAAQVAFNRLGRVDRVDLLLKDGANVAAAQDAINARLPQGVRAERPARRGGQVEKMLEAFHFNLTALSYIALLVGLFLIYNTVSISVITRRPEIGTLRALGTTRGQVLTLFLAEAGAMAAIGCALGLAFGRLLSFGAIKLTATTVSALYIATAAAPPPLSLKYTLLAFGIGLPLSLLAAAVPALEAARVAPTAAMRGNDRIESRFRLRPVYLIAPAALLTLAWWLARLPAVQGLPFFGYASALAIVFGSSLFVPVVLFLLGRLADRPLFRLFKIEGRLANANLAGSIPRVSISIAALAISLSMMTAIAVMIGSFRQTVVYWVGQTLQADLYMRPATRTNVATDAVFSPEVAHIVETHPAVASVDHFRNFDIPYGDGQEKLITLGTGEFEKQLAHGNLVFKAPADGKAAMRAAIGHDAVIVSESLAIKHAKRVGDQIHLATPQGERAFRINAIYYDYSSDRGIVVMDRATYAKYWGEPQATSFTVYLQPSANADQVRQEMLDQMGASARVLIYTNAAIRNEVLRIFDSTFAITYALEVIAIFVAILGVATTLLTLILERRRELSVLRLLGAEHRQVRKMVVIEAGLMGGVSQLVGVAVGLLLSLILIYVINVQSYGWTIQFHIPIGFLLQSSALILLATMLSGIYPARRAARLQALEQTMEE